jgi:hypothetical protein
MTIVELQTYLNRSNLLIARREDDAILVYPAKKHRFEWMETENTAIFRLTLKDEKNVNIVTCAYGNNVDHSIRGLRSSLESDVKYLGFTRR